MGITIHYRGTLDDIDKLVELTEELKTIAEAMKWEYQEIDDDWNEPVEASLMHKNGAAHIDGNLGLKGILLVPGGGSESLHFCFDKDGNLYSVMGKMLVVDGTLSHEDSWVFVKTQFASPELHAWICGLLKHLKKKYISDLEVFDDGEYWETGDMDLLRKKMDFLNQKLGQLSETLILHEVHFEMIFSFARRRRAIARRVEAKGNRAQKGRV